MSYQPCVSIALATFNGERYLREQLESIYAQSYPRIEVIAADDCSTDGTVKILDEYHRSQGLVYTVQERRQGFVKNFEDVMSRCTGEYIALADQDDVWEPHKIETLVAGIGGCSLVYSDARLIDEYGTVIAGSLIKASKVTPVTGYPFSYLVCNACVTGCTALFTRDLKELALPIPDSEPYHDWWLSIAATRLKGIAYVHEPLVRYRQHKENYAGAYVKKGILCRMYSRFTRDTRMRMRAKNELLRRRTAVYIESRDSLGLTDGEVNFLIDINRYAQGMLQQNAPMQVLSLALRRRSALFPENRLPMQILKAVGRTLKI